MFHFVPLRAAQLFVRCPSLEVLGEALSRALRRAGSIEEERTWLALHEGGWGAILRRRD